MTAKIKLVVTHILALILGAIIGAGVYGAIDNSKISVTPEEQPPAGMFIESGDNTENGNIKISSMAVPVSEYAARGLSSEIDSAQELVAEVTPAGIESLYNFTWSLKFSNQYSAWANGKNVSDYVTLSKSKSNPLHCTVTCKKAFGEPITVSVYCDNNLGISASCTLQYLKKIERITYEDYHSDCFGRGEETEPSHLVIKFSEGTVFGNFSVVNSYAKIDESASEYISDLCTAMSNYANNTIEWTYQSYPESCSLFDPVTGSGTYALYVCVETSDFVTPVDYDWQTYPDVCGNGSYLDTIFYKLRTCTSNICDVYINYTYTYDEIGYSLSDSVHCSVDELCDYFRPMNVSDLSVSEDMYF